MKIVNPSDSNILIAAEKLHQGYLIGVPTETVYGLAADATDEMAVAKIYATKERPQFNPLIIHVPSLEHAKKYAEFSDLAEDFAKTFWPGPLTMVLPAKQNSDIAKLATAGLSTIAIRVPAHPIMLELLNKSEIPLAAPSANPSGRISPTSAQHVELGFHGQAEPVMIIDGGSCKIGLESTILDLTTSYPTLLRSGGIALEALSQFCAIHVAGNSGEIKAPGMLVKHYSPRHKMRLNAMDVASDEVLLAFGKKLPGNPLKFLNLSESGNLNEAAANLFAMLHELDAINCSCIAVMPIPDNGLGLAINDRLQRAAVE